MCFKNPTKYQYPLHLPAFRQSLPIHRPFRSPFTVLPVLTSSLQADLDYHSPFDATVVSLLRSSGAVITGKTNMDEFGMGSTSTNNLVSVINPHRRKEGERLSAGGSSGGSAAVVAGGLSWAYASLFLNHSSIFPVIISLFLFSLALFCFSV